MKKILQGYVSPNKKRSTKNSMICVRLLWQMCFCLLRKPLREAERFNFGIEYTYCLQMIRYKKRFVLKLYPDEVCGCKSSLRKVDWVEQSSILSSFLFILSMKYFSLTSLLSTQFFLLAVSQSAAQRDELSLIWEKLYLDFTTLSSILYPSLLLTIQNLCVGSGST